MNRKRRPHKSDLEEIRDQILGLVFDGNIWKNEYENIFRKVSGYNVAIYLSPDKGG